MKGIKTMIKLLMIIQIVFSGVINPDSQNPVLVYRPTSSPSAAFATTNVDFCFSLSPNSLGVGYKQYIAVVFPTSDITSTTSSNFGCSLTALAPTNSITLTSTAPLVSTESNIAFCQLTDLKNTVVPGTTYRLTITFNSAVKISTGPYKNIGIFTSTDNSANRIILDSNPTFGDLAVYSDFTAAATTSMPLVFAVNSLTNSAGTTPLTIFETALLNFQITSSNFVGANYNIIITWDSTQFTSSSVGITSPVVTGTSPTTVQYVPSTGNTMTVTPFPSSTSNNAVLFNIPDTLSNTKPYVFQMKGLTATDLPQTKSIYFFAYYKNTYTVVSYLNYSAVTSAGSILSTGSSLSAYDYTSTNGMSIVMGGSYNLQFALMPSISIPNPFYVVVQHSNYALGTNKANFIASTCDFNDYLTTSSSTLSSTISVTSGSQNMPVCFPLRIDFQYTGANGSGIVFKYPAMTTAVGTAPTNPIKFNVFIYCEQCSNTAPSLGATPNTVPAGTSTFSNAAASQSSFSFTASFYRAIDQTKSNESRVNSSNLIAQTASALSIACRQAYTIGFSGKGYFDISEAYGTTASTVTVSGTSIFRDINDFYLPYISSSTYAGNNLNVYVANASAKTSNTYSGTSTAYNLFTGLNGYFIAYSSGSYVGPTIVFGNLLGSSTSTGKLNNSGSAGYLAILGTVLMGNLLTQTTAINSGNTLCNYIACASMALKATPYLASMTDFKMEMFVGNGRSWFSTGDAANCFFSWGFSLMIVKGNKGSLTPGLPTNAGFENAATGNFYTKFSNQINLLNTTKATAPETSIVFDTASAKSELNNLFNIVGVGRPAGDGDMTAPTVTTSGLSYTSGKTASTLPTIAVIGTSAAANGGMAFPDVYATASAATVKSGSNTLLFAVFNSCLKWNSSNDFSNSSKIVSQFWYVDIQLNVLEVLTGTTYALSRTNRFMKFITDSSIADPSLTTSYLTGATPSTTLSDYNVVIHGVNFNQPISTTTALKNLPQFSYNSVCLIQIDKVNVGVNYTGTSNLLLVSLSNLMLLETDITDVSSTYPTSQGNSFAYSSVPTFSTGFRGVTYSGNYPWYLWDYGSNGGNIQDTTNGEQLYLGASSQNYAAAPSGKIPAASLLGTNVQAPRTIHKLFLGSSIWITYSGFPTTFTSDILIPTYCPVASTPPAWANANDPTIAKLYNAPLIQLNFLTTNGFQVQSVNFNYAAPSNTYGQGCNAVAYVSGTATTQTMQSCSGSYFTTQWLSYGIAAFNSVASPSSTAVTATSNLNRQFTPFISSKTGAAASATPADFSVATFLRWQIMGNTNVAAGSVNQLLIVPNVATTATVNTYSVTTALASASPYKATAFMLFASPLVSDDTTISATNIRGFYTGAVLNSSFFGTPGSVAATSTAYYNGSTNSKTFFIAGSKFNRGYYVTGRTALTASTNLGYPTVPTLTAGTASASASIANGSYFNGLVRPNISASIVNNQINIANTVAFFSANDGLAAAPVDLDYNYYSNYFNGGNYVYGGSSTASTNVPSSANTTSDSSTYFFNFAVDFFSFSTLTASNVNPTIKIAADNSGDVWAADPYGNLKITLTFPTTNSMTLPGTSLSQVTVKNLLIGSNTVCGVMGSAAVIASDCSTPSGTSVNCPIVTDESASLNICCYGIAFSSTALSFTLVNSADTNAFTATGVTVYPSTANKNYYFIDLAVGGSASGTYTLPTSPVISTTAFNGSITSVTYPLLYYPGAYSKAVFTVTLPRAIARNSKLTISGNFAAYAVPTGFTGSTRCLVNFGTTPNYANGDLLIDRCTVTFSSSGSIVVDVDSKIYKCGLALSTSVVIQIWPVTANLPVTTNTYTIQNQVNSSLSLYTTTAAAIPVGTLPTLTAVTQNATFLSAVTANNYIIGQLTDFNFTMDLSSIPTNIVSQEFHIFFPSPTFFVSSSGLDQLSCSFSNNGATATSVPCQTLEDNWVRVYVKSASAAKNQVITISGIIAPQISSNLTFLVQTVYVDSYGIRTPQLVGVATYTYTAEVASAQPYIRLNSITTSTALEPRQTASSISINASIDSLYVTTSPLPITLAGSPYFIVTLPFPDYNLSMYKSVTITATINENNTSSGTTTQKSYTIGTITVSNNKIIIPFTVTSGSTTVTLASTFTSWDITLSGIPTPVDSTKTSAGRFRLALTNQSATTAATYVYRDYSNLSLVNIGKITPTDAQSLITGYRGLSYAFNSGKYVVDITNCSVSNPAFTSMPNNFIYVKPGRASMCYFTLRWLTYKTGLAPDSTTITLNDPNSMFTMSPSSVTLYTINNAASFWIGSPCSNNLPGTYYVTFNSSNNSVFYSLPPVAVYLDQIGGASNVSTGSISALTIPDIAPGGEYPFTLSSTEYPVDTLTFAVAVDTTVATDPKASVPTSVSISNFTNSGSSMFSSPNVTYTGNAQFVFTSPVALSYCWGNTTMKVNFKIGTTVTQINPLSYTVAQLQAATVATADTTVKNQLNVVFTPPASPLYLYCVLACVYTTLPTDIRNPASTLLGPLYKYYSTYVGSTTKVNFQFTGLARGQQYQMRCAISNTYVSASNNRTLASYDIFTQATPYTVSNGTAPSCVQFTSSGFIPKLEFTNQLLWNCQSYLSKYKMTSSPSPNPTLVNPACMLCQDTYRNFTLGVSDTAGSRCTNPTQKLLRFLQSTTTTTTTTTNSTNSTNVTVILPSYSTNICIFQDRVCGNDLPSGTDTISTAVNSWFGTVKLLNAPLATFLGIPASNANITTLPTLILDSTAVTTNVTIYINSGYYIPYTNSTSFYLNITSPSNMMCYYYLYTNTSLPLPTFNSVADCSNSSICGSFRVGNGTNFTIVNINNTVLTASSLVNASVWAACQNDIPNSYSALGSVLRIWNFTSTNNGTGNAPSAIVTPVPITPVPNTTNNTNTTTTTNTSTVCTNGTYPNGTKCSSKILEIAKMMFAMISLALILTI